MIKHFLIMLATYILAALIGAGVYSKLNKPQTIEKLIVKEIDRPVFKYIKQVEADDLRGLYAAYKSRIEISYYTSNKNLHIVASDGYKKTSAVYQIQETADYRVYFGIGGAAALGGAILMYKIIK